MEPAPIHLAWDAGTIVVTGPNPEQLAELPFCQSDPRSGTVRAEARHYRTLVEHLRKLSIAYKDEARSYDRTAWELVDQRKPFPHQAEAVETWWQAGGRGIVVLPTGTGKTFVAILAIHKAQRPALVVTPTIDLLNQWHDELRNAFG